MKSYVVLDKKVGETPLQCMEAWRADAGDIYKDLPLTYAGRLDPMASGKLLILIGEECKKKDEFLTLDKTYEFSILFGIGSDTHDILGRLITSKQQPEDTLLTQLQTITANLVGPVELPYPHFSSKTVDGKPLHMWTLEDRLDEITIPTKTSTIHSLTVNSLEALSRETICESAQTKINTLPPVTDKRKQLGADFRRADVRADWESIKTAGDLPVEYTIAHFTCAASSGTYMRTLAKLIGEQLNPSLPSLAWSIHRTHISGF